MNSSDPSSVWRSISSACESGWDFSSRWMQSNNTGVVDIEIEKFAFLVSADLSSIHTDQIVPVDLNVIIAKNYIILASYSDHFGNFE